MMNEKYQISCLNSCYDGHRHFTPMVLNCNSIFARFVTVNVLFILNCQIITCIFKACFHKIPSMNTKVYTFQVTNLFIVYWYNIVFYEHKEPCSSQNTP